MCARTLTAVPERFKSAARAAFRSAEGRGEPRPVTTEDAAVVEFETDRGAIGSTVISQISPGRKNRLFLELSGAEEGLSFDQEEPESLMVGRRESATIVKRDPAFLSDAAARLATLPAGHPQGYADCFDAFTAEVYAAVAGQPPADGLPTFADGQRAAQITDAVMRSAGDGRWVEVTAGEL